MNKQNGAHATAEASTMRRLASVLSDVSSIPADGGYELMDYGPYDYTLDRIGQLESRVMELERVRNVTNRLRSAPDGVMQIGISRDATDGGIL